MGPTLARLARNAMPGRRVIAVARFSEPGVREGLRTHGIETIPCDLLDRDAVGPCRSAPTSCSWPGASSAPTATTR